MVKFDFSTYNKICLGHAQCTWVLPYMAGGLYHTKQIQKWIDGVNGSEWHNLYLFVANQPQIENQPPDWIKTITEMIFLE